MSLLGCKFPYKSLVFTHRGYNITPLSLITYYVSIDKLVHTRLHSDEVESEFQIVASTASMLEKLLSNLVNKFPISIASILSASNCTI